MSTHRLVLVALIVLATGCTWDTALRRRRDAALLARNDPPRYDIQSPDLPPPPLLVQDTMRVFGNPAENKDGSLELYDAMLEGLRNSRVVRVSDGTSTGAAPVTGYDVDAAQAQVRAALAAFDTTLGTNFIASRFRAPPNAFFGPGLKEPLRCDQLIYGAGLTKPLTTGGTATLFYDPSPGYLFLPGGNGNGFN